MVTVLRTIVWAMLMLLILPAVIPVLVVFMIKEYSEYVKNPINIDEDWIKKIAYKALKYGLVPVCILGVISIKALVIYMAVGSILGIVLLLVHYYYVK